MIVDRINGVTKEYELDAKVTIEDYMKEHWKVCRFSFANEFRWLLEIVRVWE